MGKYYDELQKSMEWLGEKPDTFFLGQSIVAGGTGMTNSFQNVTSDKKLETPVFEHTQMAMTIGMSLNNTIPISVFPRWDFLLLAADQIVNHLNRIVDMSDFRPKVIIRTSIGSIRPLHPFHQHCNDYTDAFQLMCKNVEFIRLDEPEDIFPAYKKAYERTDGKSTVLVEYGDYLSEK